VVVALGEAVLEREKAVPAAGNYWRQHETEVPMSSLDSCFLTFQAHQETPEGQESWKLGKGACGGSHPLDIMCR
jgi:hypothetical protein